MVLFCLFLRYRCQLTSPVALQSFSKTLEEVYREMHIYIRYIAAIVVPYTLKINITMFNRITFTGEQNPDMAKHNVAVFIVDISYNPTPRVNRRYLFELDSKTRSAVISKYFLFLPKRNSGSYSQTEFQIESRQ